MSGAGAGRFITFEGGEGAGKSTQVKLLKTAMEAAGKSLVATREPGGSPGAEEIRALVLGGGIGRWDAVTETLLFYAARRDHLETLIRPALARGDWVLCDRFEDSTRAYQTSSDSGLAAPDLEGLGRLVRGDLTPDLTLILDLPVPLGRARAAGRNQGSDRFEQRDDAFHERVRTAYLAIAAAESDRCVVVDASLPIESVALAIREIVSVRFGIRSLEKTRSNGR
jgi:dTMP kinase